MENQVKLKIALMDKIGNKVNGEIAIRDGLALAKFDNNYTAKELYKYEKKKGENVSFSEIGNIYIKHYPRKKIKEIAEILSKELKKSGINVKR